MPLLLITFNKPLSLQKIKTCLPGNIQIKDYDYPLPPSRIAQFPLEKRDESKLLIWKEGKITASVFAKIADELPEESILVFNDTKVIRARLIFSKNTGATIEVFCLEPLSPVTEIQASFAQTASCTWKCLVGNVKRWKYGILQKSFVLEGNHYTLSAEKKENLGDGCFSILFRWEPSGLSFSEIIDRAGMVPLPPYITRASTHLTATGTKPSMQSTKAPLQLRLPDYTLRNQHCGS